MTENAFDRCARCGALRQDHRLANYADGPPVGAAFTVCPTATFLEPGAAVTQDNAELRALMADDVSAPPRRES